MKAVIIAESESIIQNFSNYLTNKGYDIIVYHWLMKALDNIEEINPDLVVINAQEFPRHWKIFCQYASAIENPAKIVLYTPVSLKEDEDDKAKALGIEKVITTLPEDEVQEEDAVVLPDTDTITEDIAPEDEIPEGDAVVLPDTDTITEDIAPEDEVPEEDAVVMPDTDTVTEDIVPEDENPEEDAVEQPDTDTVTEDIVPDDEVPEEDEVVMPDTDTVTEDIAPEDEIPEEDAVVMPDTDTVTEDIAPEDEVQEEDAVVMPDTDSVTEDIVPDDEVPEEDEVVMPDTDSVTEDIAPEEENPEEDAVELPDTDSVTEDIAPEDENPYMNIAEKLKEKEIVQTPTDCKFMFSHPETNALITGKVQRYEHPVLEFIPANMEETKDLKPGLVINDCPLKVNDKMQEVDVEVKKNGEFIEFTVL